ncbi:aminopeptidase N [Actinopolymorpha sp. B17G11]|uniref:aminopeptidase N n=1 Tax=Actinopolymorpha sp. B17G11 TaxID=3160861 RepID=UPI0032E38B5A
MPTSLTLAEAQRRARLVNVHAYSVDLDFTRGEEVFGSSTVIRFGCTEPGAATFAELRPVTLHKAVLNGRGLDPGSLRDGRLPLTDLAGNNELRVEADMRYTRTGEGMHRFTDPADGEVYVYTQCAPDEAPGVFGCFDQPDLKASFDIAVTAPTHWTVLSNGVAESSTNGRWSFATTPPISTYLAVVVGGALHSVRTEHDGIPLGLHCRKSLAPSLTADSEEIFDITRRSFDRYHETFAERYAFGKYDQAFVPELNWGAVENPACVTFSENHVFRGAVTDTERQTRAIVIAHELAHMWFGNLVTMRWWDDLWLNESFAEYMGYQVVTDTGLMPHAWTSFAVSRKPWGSDADQRASTHPVAAQRIDNVADALVNFDGISYAKGASALRQLVAWVGEEAFLAGVNAHFARHRFGNAGLADLVDALARSSGRDVHGWTERWLRTSGVDTIRAELTDRNGTVTSADLIHTGSGGGKEGLRPHRIVVGVYDLGEDHAGVRRLVRRERFESDLAADPVPEQRGQDALRSALTPLVGARRPDLLVLNDGDRSYTKVRLNARSWATVTEALSTVDDALTRALLWSIARDMVRDAELPPAEYINLVEAHLPAEPVVAIVEAVLAFARHEVADRYLAPDGRAAALGTLAGACRAILRRTTLRRATLRRATLRRTTGNDEYDAGVGLAALRGLIESEETGGGLDELQGWLANERIPGGPALDPELRWLLLRQLCIAGAAGEPEIAAELERDPSGVGQQRATTCRAALPDGAAKERAWRQLFADGELSKQLLDATASGFWQPSQPSWTAGFVERYFAEIPKAGRLGQAVAAALGHTLFPAHAATPATVRLAEECLARDDLTPTLRRFLGDRLDDLRRAVRVRADNAPEAS